MTQMTAYELKAVGSKIGDLGMVVSQLTPAVTYSHNWRR